MFSLPIHKVSEGLSTQSPSPYQVPRPLDKKGRSLRDWSLITGRGGYKTGGHVKFYPYEKAGGGKSFHSLKGGGGEKFYPVLRGVGRQKFWTRNFFHFVAPPPPLPVINDQSLSMEGVVGLWWG